MPTTAILNSTMFHREVGTGRPIDFLHGNPASSHL
jgi:haloalkane dehalogenase